MGTVQTITPTAKQRRLLGELGYTGTHDGVTPAAASELLQELIAERKAQTDAMIEAAKATAAQIDLAELAGERTQLAKISSQEYAGACPRCGGTKRFHVTAQWFFCRHCHEQRGDALAYLAWLNGTDFVTTCQQLVGGSLPVATAAPSTPAPKERKEQGADWAQGALRKLATAQAKLLADDDAGAAGRAYLLGRGLQPETWAAYGVGLADVALPGTWDETTKTHTQPLQPAIVLPWFAQGGRRLVALRYRFLQNHTYTIGEIEQHTKQTALYGSDFTQKLFGGQTLPEFVFMPATMPSAERGRALLICEGETNAMSVYQVAHESRLDVLSIGSESAALPENFSAWAGRYGQILTWLDRSDLAAKVALKLQGAHAIASKSMSGCDANDLLQQGLLGAFLATVRIQLCRSDTERQALYWALMDAAQGDAGTVQVVQRFAQNLTLGKP